MNKSCVYAINHCWMPYLEKERNGGFLRSYKSSREGGREGDEQELCLHC